MKTYFGFAIADSMFKMANRSRSLIRRLDLSVDQAIEMIETAKVNGTLESALNPSHRATIDAMRSRYGIEVPIPDSPPKVNLSLNDKLIIMAVQGLPRLTDSHEYSQEQIRNAHFSFVEWEIVQVNIKN